MVKDDALNIEQLLAKRSCCGLKLLKVEVRLNGRRSARITTADDTCQRAIPCLQRETAFVFCPATASSIWPELH